MIWRGNSENLRGERDGRVLEVKIHSDGTWRLLVWKENGASIAAGVFSDRNVACHAGERIPLDDASLARLAADPYPATRFADNVSRET